MLQCFVEKLFHINWTQFIGLALGAGVIIIDVSFGNFLFKQMVLTIDLNTLSDNRKKNSNPFDNDFHKLKYSQIERKISNSKY